MKIEHGKTGVTTSRSGVWWTMPLLRQLCDAVQADDPVWGTSVSLSSIAEILENLDQDMRPGKAFSKTIFKLWGIKLSSKTIAEVGNLIAALPEEPLTLRLTLGCDGTREEYYNDRSCWWTNFPRARDILHFNGGGAIRAYKNDELIGRAWFLPYEDWIVLFNFYGQGALQHAQTWMTVTSQAFDWITAIQSIDFECSKEDLYVNSPTCVVAGTVPAPRIYAIKPELDVPYLYAKKEIRCENCGHRFPEENVHFMEDTLIEPGYYCENCERNLLQITAGSYVGEWCFSNSVVYLDDEIYFHGDQEIMLDPYGIWCRCADAIQVGEFYYAHQSLVMDEYGTPHPRNRDTWQRCEWCGKIYPRRDEHFAQCRQQVHEQMKARRQNREQRIESHYWSGLDNIIFNGYTKFDPPSFFIEEIDEEE